MKLNRVQQAIAMVEALSMHSADIEVAVCRHIGRLNETVLAKKWDQGLMGWFSFENAKNNANIWIRPQPEINHPWLLLDDLPIIEARKLACKYQCVVVETSIGNCQVRILANTKLSREQRKLVQVELVKSYIRRGINADAGSTAGSKWSRLPGFRNRKPNRDCWTNLLSLPDPNLPIFDPAPYINVDSPTTKVVGVSQSKKTMALSISFKNINEFNDGLDISSRDFGYIFNRLKFLKITGRDYLGEAEVLKNRLIQTTQKKNPCQYADLTINAVLKRLL